MGRVSARDLTAIQQAVVQTQTDAEGQRVVADLLSKIVSGADVNPLISKFWALECVGIKSVRAAINSLDSVFSNKINQTVELPLLHSYLFFIKELVSTPRHVQHLNASEWLNLWSAVSRVPFYPQLFASVCTCWSELLCATNSVPRALNVVVESLTSVTQFQREQAFDGYLMLCLRQVHEFLLADCNRPLKSQVEAYAIDMWTTRTKVKNTLFCKEVAVLSSRIDCELAADQAHSLYEHLRPHLNIYPICVAFNDNIENKVGGKFFTAQPQTDLLPWICSRALVNVSRLKQDYQEPMETMETTANESLPKRRKLDCMEPSPQLACFGSVTVQQSLSQDRSFWWFVWVGQNTHLFTPIQLVELCTTCINCLNENHSGAPFCLARLVIELTQQDQQPDRVINMLISFMSALDHSPITSGSIYLFRALKSLHILDLGFTRLLSTKLDPWLNAQLAHSLSTLQVPLSVFTDLIGVDIKFDLSTVKPTRGSFLTYLGLCLYSHENTVFELPSKLIKSDLVAIIELVNIITPLNLSIPSEVAQELAILVKDTQAEQSLRWQAQFLLVPTAPSVEQFAYAPLPAEITPSFFKEIVSKIFSSYSFNRDPAYILQIINMMDRMHITSAWDEFYSYLFSMVTSQSPFSPLRVPISKLVSKAEDWKKLFDSSTPTETLSMCQNLTLQSSDTGTLLASHVDPSIRGEFLYNLACSGGSISTIIVELLDTNMHNYVERIALYFGTTSEGMFRDVCPKAFFVWSMRKPLSEFPWDSFDCPESLRLYFPLVSLTEDWIEDKDMFALYYVVGLEDVLVSAHLQAAYTDRQYSALVKRNSRHILLLCWSSRRIPADDFWNGFPEPAATDTWMSTVPSDYDLDNDSAVWVMEQLVLSVCRFRKEDLYCTMRKLWAIYRTIKIPQSISTMFLRCCICLVQQDKSLLNALKHIFGFLVRENLLEGVWYSEILAQYPELIDIVDDIEIPDEPLYNVVTCLCQKVPISLELWPKAFGDLEKEEFPLYYAQFLCKNLDLSLEFTVEQRIVLSPHLYRWTNVLGLSEPKWLAWVGRLVAEFPVDTVTPYIEYSQDRMIEFLRSFCSDHGYLERIAISPFIQRIGPSVMDSELKSKSLFNSFKDLTPKDLLVAEKGPESGLLNPSITCEELSIQLFERISSISLYKAFRISPGLAQKLLPYEVARVCEDERLLKHISQIISVQLSNPNSDVQKLLLEIVSEAYSVGYLLTDLEPLVKSCVKLGYGDLGLMLVELLWSDTSVVPQIYSSVVNIIDDPDIRFSTHEPPSLSSLNLNSWDSLGFTLTSFENNDHAASSLRTAGIYKLANLLEKESYYDYCSAWALQQWELPESPQPKTKCELLFNLFREPELNFTKAYKDGWKMGALTDIFSIENITGPEVCLNKEMRLAREYYFEKTKDSDTLLMDLCLNCKAFCQASQKELALMYAQKIEKLVLSMPDEAKWMSQIQSARTVWLLGDQTTSIGMLEQVTQYDGFDASQLFSPSSVLCTLAEWSAEAHHVSDSMVFEKYLNPAIKSALSSRDITVQADTYHTFAKFCDERFKDPVLASELSQARYMRDEQKKQLETLKVAAKESKDRAIPSKLRKAAQLYDTEQKEYQGIKERRLKYLDNSIGYYLKSLQLGRSETISLHDSGRFIALWFANSHSPSVEKIIDQQIQAVPGYIFIPWINQLTSRLDNPNTPFQKQLSKLVRRLATKHPYHTLWPLLSLSLSGDSDNPALVTRAIAGKQIWRACNSEYSAGISELGQHMIAVANYKVKSEDKSAFSFSKMRTENKWWREKLKTMKLVCPVQSIPVDASGKYENVPVISEIDPKVSIASGISAPKIIQYVASDGNVYTMLVKGGNDDMRQDAVMEQVFGHVNIFLRADPDTRRRKLSARTYNVVPIGPKAGIIEFVANTKSLISILMPLHQNVDSKGWNLSKARDTMHRAYEYGKEARYAAYDEVTRHVRPCMREFFFSTYRDPQTWLEKRTNYSRSTALMSIIGYILGLGDRHCNNILIDIKSGEVVHIDLGIAFDQGKLLRIPETVPFRLTRDIVDGLGASGINGIFSRCAEVTLDILRVEEERIMTVLEVLRYDPLYSWTVSPARNRHAQPGSTVNFIPSSTDADQALFGVKRKLSEKLNSKATIRELIHVATSSHNLALIFEGWSPFY